MKKKPVIIWCCWGTLFLVLNAMGCAQKKEGHPLARAFGKELTWSEVEPLMAGVQNSADSANLLKRITDQWISRQVKLNIMGKNAAKDDPAIAEKVENYRNDLVIYNYEQNKIDEQLDTNITLAEMKHFFEHNRDNFHLSNNVVRLVFVKIKAGDKNSLKIKPLLLNMHDDNKTELLELCDQYAVNSFLDDNVWLNFDDIIKEVPIKTYDVQHFLENNKYVEIKEGAYLYLVHILAYQVKNTSPVFEFERDNIKKVILQNRKKELLRQLELNIKKEAELNKEIESFVN